MPNENVPTVLVADDDESFARSLSAQLRKRGFRVLNTTDGQSALSLILERSPAVAIVSAEMAGFDLSQCMTALRGAKLAKPTTIVVLTAETRPCTEANAHQSDAVQYEIKSKSTPAQLAERIRQLNGR